MVIIPSKRAPLAKGRQEDWGEAREAYLLAHAPGLKEHYAVQQRAFSQIKEDAQNRHPDPTPEDIAAALAAEAALPYRKRTEAQCVETLSLWQRTFPWTSRASASGSSNWGSGHGTKPISAPDG